MDFSGPENLIGGMLRFRSFCRDMGVFINKGVDKTRFPLLHVKLIPLKRDLEVHDTQSSSEYSSKRLAIVKDNLLYTSISNAFFPFLLLRCSATALTLLNLHTCFYYFFLSLIVCPRIIFRLCLSD